jgi:hypothetical protein
MKRKILLSFLIIFLILIIGQGVDLNKLLDNTLALVGYGGKEKIKGVINNYFSALSEGRYELAKTYCISDGIQYKFTEDEQKKQNPIIKITFTPCITKWNWVEAGDAFVNVEIVMTSTGIFGISANETIESLAFLSKISGVWKLK